MGVARNAKSVHSREIKGIDFTLVEGGFVPTKRAARKEVYLAKTTAELSALSNAGVLMAGNAFSSVTLVKGVFDTEDVAAGAGNMDTAAFSYEDGRALHASLEHLGYAPEDWSALLTVGADGTPLALALLREALTALDPATVLICDNEALDAIRNAYALELSKQATAQAAFLEAGIVVEVAGMRFLNLDNFAGALGDSHQKQLRWAYLKQLPPLGEPY